MNTVSRSLRDQAKRALYQLFVRGQYLRVDILPRHFYSQIPDLRELRSTGDWKQPREMSSIPGHDLDSQLRFAESTCKPDFLRRAAEIDVYRAASARNGEVGFGPVEAYFLYAFMREKKPQRIVQVGCGVSTAVMLAAARDAGYKPHIRCIEPYPTTFLQQASANAELELVREKAQRVVRDDALRLADGDLLFVDSTHTVMPGSEVNVIILDVLPQLAPGVLVHFHDIMFPYDYSRWLLNGELFFHGETALLHGFLSCNDRYEILASLAMLHYGRLPRMKEMIPIYQPSADDYGLEKRPGHFPSSIYLRRLPNSARTLT